MSAAQDPFLDNLGLFTALLDGQLGLEVGAKELVTTCGDREEIVAYLLLKTRFLQVAPRLAEQMKAIARITPQASRAPVQSSNTLEDVVGIADGNTRICRTLQDIFGSELANSPLAKELEHARHRLAIERLAEGPGDQAMFDRINPN